MMSRLYGCEKCSGTVMLAYNGWCCAKCGRKYLLRAGRIEEMWWKNQNVKNQTPEPVGAH